MNSSIDSNVANLISEERAKLGSYGPGSWQQITLDEAQWDRIEAALKDAERYRARRYNEFYTSLSCTGTSEDQFNALYDAHSDTMRSLIENIVSPTKEK